MALGGLLGSAPDMRDVSLRKASRRAAMLLPLALALALAVLDETLTAPFAAPGAFSLPAVTRSKRLSCMPVVAPSAAGRALKCGSSPVIDARLLSRFRADIWLCRANAAGMRAGYMV